MATFDADIIRATALELQERTRVLYIDVLSIYQTARTWTLNGIDPALPMPFDVKVQLDSYQALSLDRLRLGEWVTAIQKAAPGDTLTYPPPGTLSGQIQFDEISFEHLTF
jgi:hypothetical protein